MVPKKNIAKRKNYGNLSLTLHRKLKGKIEVAGKVPVRNREDLSLVYTPGVGAVSSYLAKHRDQVGRYTMKSNTVAVVSDGSAVLGLGNIGPEGALPVMEGKSLLFKSLAGIDAFPIVLDTQETEEVIRTVKHIAPVFGGINLEDIAAPRCFEIESRLHEILDIPVMHDDQHGTAMVVLAGLINAFRVVKKNLRKGTIVISGAGAAGTAIAEILLLYGVGDIVMVDSQGIVESSRTNLNTYKRALAKKTNRQRRTGTLADALIGADAYIGVSKPGVLKPLMIKKMSDRPVVFALANPVPEILPDEAKKAGVMVVATGRSDFPNQINNSLGFPGIFRGALDHRVKKITDVMLVRAAINLARLVARPNAERIIPSTFDKGVVDAVAKAIRG